MDRHAWNRLLIVGSVYGNRFLSSQNSTSCRVLNMQSAFIKNLEYLLCHTQY